jgi:acetylornithine/N-succinyldiaminopimelate aminotransferase
MVIGTHGSTYGGNPLAMAVGQAVLEVVAEPGFLAHVRRMGDRLRQALEQMIPNHDQLFDSVRGKGLMLGVKLKSDSRRFVAHCRDNHQLLTVAAGDNVVRVLPPLVIEQAHIDEFVAKLSDAARTYVPATDD